MSPIVEQQTAPTTPSDYDRLTLENTIVVPTLDAPLEPGKNVVWCASFQAAWKRLQHDLVKEPVRLNGAGALVEALNKAPDPAEDIPEEWLYAAAGLTGDGIIERIIREMADRFPDKKEPDIRSAVGFVAYAYLEAGLKFPEPYLQNFEPLLFTDSRGRQTPISSFGLREHDQNGYFNLRMQARLLYAELDEQGVQEIAVDLWGQSESVQLVLARVKPGKTLKATLARVMPWSDEIRYGPLAANAVLLIPDMEWRLKWRLTELEGLTITNAGLSLPPIAQAEQDIAFKLDRSGAQLSSEASALSRGISVAEYFVFDRPFLLYMKMRDAQTPFLAMWVDNAELLKPFSAEDALAAFQSISEASSQRIQTIAGNVKAAAAQHPGDEFKGTTVYRAYKDVLAEAERAQRNGQLDQEMLDDLAEYASQVIALHEEWQERYAAAGPGSPPDAAPSSGGAPAGQAANPSEKSWFGRLLDNLRGR